MSSLLLLSDENLFKVFEDALMCNVDTDFIELIADEINRRQLSHLLPMASNY
ncbi:sporulation histidine kinase inhibitor Sda [Bacillus infantis]|uniref:sporulation histidine kinase inhibitor Sda n=1 Tax=Bacillus infantis TaxID=324767 RepID=UPI002004FFEC|nr:sporulation histidine kinase inhibitor Sda [Bacillus infantis]MCK6206035.1 sporulation histidine kinase inhibitor Sda [Bacillus infantis]